MFYVSLQIYLNRVVILEQTITTFCIQTQERLQPRTAKIISVYSVPLWLILFFPVVKFHNLAETDAGVIDGYQLGQMNFEAIL